VAVDPAVQAARDTLAYNAGLTLARGVPRLDIEQLILAAFGAQARGLGWIDIRDAIRLAEMAPAAMGDDRERHAREGKAGGGSSAPTQDEGVDPGPSGNDQPASPDPSLARLGRLEAEVERLNFGVDALRSYLDTLLDGLMRKVGANGSTDTHSLDHRVAELERQAKTAGQTASATKFGSPVESPSHSERCHSCGRTYSETVWRADDELWRKVSGGFGLLCPRCFDDRAKQLGLMLTWKPEVFRTRVDTPT
jgi:hypothetical protein